MENSITNFQLLISFIRYNITYIYTFINDIIKNTGLKVSDYLVAYATGFLVVRLKIHV